MSSIVDIPSFKVQHLLNSPTRFSGPALYLLLSSAVVFALWHLLFTRPHASKNAPKAWNVYDWPVVGSALSFYSRRRDMVLEGVAASQHGNFSFYVGKKHVIAMSGPDGRKTFYESRALNFSAGLEAPGILKTFCLSNTGCRFVELLAGMPFTQEADATGDDWPRYFNKTLVTMIRPEMLQTKVPLLRSDVRATCDRLAAQSASASA